MKQHFQNIIIHMIAVEVEFFSLHLPPWAYKNNMRIRRGSLHSNYLL